jgi:hypothetical protein
MGPPRAFADFRPVISRGAKPADRVRGVTDARNAASIRVLERAGFVKVGEQRAVFKGEACVEFVYVTHRAARRPSLHGRAGLSSPQVNHGAARTRRGRP